MRVGRSTRRISRDRLAPHACGAGVDRPCRLRRRPRQRPAPVDRAAAAAAGALRFRPAAERRGARRRRRRRLGLSQPRGPRGPRPRTPRPPRPRARALPARRPPARVRPVRELRGGLAAGAGRARARARGGARRRRLPRALHPLPDRRPVPGLHVGGRTHADAHPRRADAGRVGAGGRPGRRGHRPARRRLRPALRGRRPAPLQPRRRRRLHGRRRPDRLHAGHAPRLRRRPHRGHRQHDAQVHAGGPAAAQRRLLLRARALDRGLRARAAALARRQGAGRVRSRTAARPCTRSPA